MYEQAINSVEYKKKMRLEKAKENYSEFKKVYTDSEYINEVDKMASNLDKELKKYSTKS